MKSSARVAVMIGSLVGTFLTCRPAVGAAAFQWENASGSRHAALIVAANLPPGFTPMTASTTGIYFTNSLAPERGLTNQILLSGSGLAAGDLDGDGWCDLYICNLDGANALFRNLGEWRFTNVAAQSGVELRGQNSTGAVVADVDGDGDLDLLVSSIGHGVRLFLNERGNDGGQGTNALLFSEATAKAGLGKAGGAGGGSASMTMTLADVDGDGDLDLYVTNLRTDTFQDRPPTRFTLSKVGGQPVITRIDGQPATLPEFANRYSVTENGQVIEHAEPDVLYRNDGSGHFTATSWTDGAFLDENGSPLASPPTDWGLSAMFRDMNGDGTPDLYVCNDTHSPDRIWINQSSQTRILFRALPWTALRQTCFSSMGVDFADLNRDGQDEFFVVDMLAYEHTNRHTQTLVRQSGNITGIEERPSYQRNMLYLNRADGTYAEIAQFSGVAASDWSWCPLFLDVDLDGYEDLLITTGQERNLMHADTRRQIDHLQRTKRLSYAEFIEARKLFGRFDCPNFAFRNRGDLTFENVSASWKFDSRDVSNGICLADLDNDGDLDVAVNCLNAAPLLYRNNAPGPRMAVRLKGIAANTRGVGARIKLTKNSGPKESSTPLPLSQSQEMICGGRYLSSDDFLRTFAGGTPTNEMTIEVTWRSGKKSTVSAARPNHIYEVDEAYAGPGRREGRPTTVDLGLLFKDVSELLNHTHYESPFDDFAQQPLLTKRLTHAGPGVGWFDIDSDGLEDLLIGGGSRGIYRNVGNGRFERADMPALFAPAQYDRLMILGWTHRPYTGTNQIVSTNALLITQSRCQAGATNSVMQCELRAGEPTLRVIWSGIESTVGPLALGDIDADGDLDLLVTGRIVPAQYPKPATSRLYVNDKNKFEPRQDLIDVGVVNSAVFTDLDGDGVPELALACEWGPIKVFRNEQGRLTPWDAPVRFTNSQISTLSKLSGWWQGITAGDFDGDGRMDLVAANWGRNHRYNVCAAHPIEAWLGTNAEGIGLEYLEGYFDPALKKIVPWQRWDLVAAAVPQVFEHITSFEQFSTAGLADIFARSSGELQRLAVNTFESMVLLNRGDQFDAIPLPLEAQLSPAFGVCVADFDGDGDEDIFLSQNFFAVDRETSRYDAGRGLLLRNDGFGPGQNGFSAVPGQESGLLIYGEGRGAAVCDYDRDGRADLVAAQNSAATRLFHNQGARPGLRVRLRGLPDNPLGIGAVLRLAAGSRLGPAREIHAGAGYYSQDSAVQVMAMPEQPTQLLVRWPGGKTVTYPVRADMTEMVASLDGR